MNVLRTLLSIITVSVVFTSCNYDVLHEADALDVDLKERLQKASPTGEISHFILPESTDYDQIPHDPKNLLTPEKIALGKYLFYETGMAQVAAKESGMETYSCATCHVPSAGFKPGAFNDMQECLELQFINNTVESIKPYQLEKEFE